MSREPGSGRRRWRAGPFAKERAQSRAMWYKVGGVAAFLVVLSFAASWQTSSGHHPTPRDMDHTGYVVSSARYQAYPRVAETYQMVASVPQVVDGVYCYCQCKEHSGHYSLLDCFHSDHAARCDVCLSEGTMAYRMSQDGKDLKAIRAEIDSRFHG